MRKIDSTQRLLFNWRNLFNSLRHYYGSNQMYMNMALKSKIIFLITSGINKKCHIGVSYNYIIPGKKSISTATKKLFRRIFPSLSLAILRRFLLGCRFFFPSMMYMHTVRARTYCNSMTTFWTENVVILIAMCFRPYCTIQKL